METQVEMVERTEIDYCPHLNRCKETRRELCYSQGYRNCTFYEVNITLSKMHEPKKEKGLAERVTDKLGVNHKNWGQI